VRALCGFPPGGSAPDDTGSSRRGDRRTNPVAASGNLSGGGFA